MSVDRRSCTYRALPSYVSTRWRPGVEYRWEIHWQGTEWVLSCGTVVIPSSTSPSLLLVNGNQKNMTADFGTASDRTSSVCKWGPRQKSANSDVLHNLGHRLLTLGSRVCVFVMLTTNQLLGYGLLLNLTRPLHHGFFSASDCNE